MLPRQNNFKREGYLVNRMAGKAKIEATLRLKKKTNYGEEFIKKIVEWVGYKLLKIEQKGDIYCITYTATLKDANTKEGNYDPLEMWKNNLRAYGVESEMDVISAKVIASNYKSFRSYISYVAECLAKGERPISDEEFYKMEEEEESRWSDLDKA